MLLGTVAAAAGGAVVGAVVASGLSRRKAAEEKPQWAKDNFEHHRGCCHCLAEEELEDLKFPLPADKVPHWSYAPLAHSGPLNWGKLCSEYSVAASGKSQSPVNIIDHDTVAADSKLSSLDFTYAAVPASLCNNGHSIQVNLEGGGVLIEGETFYMKQFHFHAPSEHTINGKQFPLEMHIVHINGTGRIAVIAVLFQHGFACPFLKQFWDVTPAESSEQVSVEKVHVGELIHDGSHYFRYFGSLTTPPCTEGVIWTVMRQVHDISAAQVQLFQERTGFVYPNPGNNRPIQPLNSRVVMTYK